ncbi:acyl-CoA thioesterase [Amnibacterium endophyticum]|uniref:Acyl-CoA thioesterase n=1 Tax=Amnibacterium endophyticum TaxID=2109337 RepID=A0ABW4LAU6_9MICO
MTKERPSLGDYRFRRAFPTRWNDDDVFGHVNNSVHYSAMDTTVTAWLLGDGGQGYAMRGDADPAFVVASSCRYFASAAFPDVLVVGLRADRIGTTSVAWGLGIFREADQALIATGTFVHVFVDRDDHRPIPVPAELRERIDHELGAPA